MPEDIVIDLDDELFARFEAVARSKGRTVEEEARLALKRAAEDYAKAHPK
ncbi:hypothetical protein [Brevundimonas sp.]|nr:hypothetical protein [Brevundimonas sp.]